MAVRLDAVGDYLYTTTGAPTTNSFTVSVWFRIQTDRNAAGPIWLVANGTGSQYTAVIRRMALVLSGLFRTWVEF